MDLGENRIYLQFNHNRGLNKTNQIFGGFKRELRNNFFSKVTERPYKYLHDFTDGFSNCTVLLKNLLVALLVAFTCVIPALAFGSYIEQKTMHIIGVKEMLFGTCFASVIFALVSGQPIMMVGGSGSKLIFEAIVYQFYANFVALEQNHHEDHDTETTHINHRRGGHSNSNPPTSSIANGYLQFRALVSLWIGLISTFFVAFEGPILVKIITPFSEEILHLMVAFVFVQYCFSSIKYVSTFFENLFFF